jgi:hypothetical protein
MDDIAIMSMNECFSFEIAKVKVRSSALLADIDLIR